MLAAHAISPMDVDVQIASAERRLHALRQQQANVIAKFARLGSVEQDQARKTYERAILEAEAELKRLLAARKI
jgi:hypothetical protein